MSSGREFHGPKDYLDLARSADATEDDLRRLAKSEHVFVRLAVAEHRRTPSDTLAELMPPVLDGWNDGALILALVRNENTDREVLRGVPSLVLPALHERNDNNAFAVGVALSQRQDTPIDLLADLVADARATTEFRKVVARETTHPELVAILRNDRSERVRRAANARGLHA